MRNLKKVLALALATVMLLGMMAMASAADYEDEAAIADKYAVAVDVMTAIGVFEGDPEGNFNPAGKLTREAAAKIAVYVALTKETAQHVAAVEAPFDDVAAARWSAGSIVAAKNLGLIDGLGNGKFDPQGDLTGYAFAKMMLGVLGYKASEEGFLGAGWEFNVNMAAAKAGLLAGLDASKLANTMTREEAAQMALNALKAQPVTYVGGSSVTINGITITTGAQKQAETYVDTKDENKAKPYANLAAKLYPTLTWDTVVDTAFGYSTIQYKYGTTPATVATAKNYTVLGSYAGDLSALTSGALYTMTNKTTTPIAVYVNGADTTTVTPAKDGTAKVLALAGKNYTGAAVDVVKNNGVYEVLVTAATVAQVDTVTPAAGEAKRTVTVTTVDTDAPYTFETENFEEDQYILIYVKAGAEKPVIKSEAIAAANTAYGTINEVAGTDGAPTAVFVDGTKYPVAGANVVGTAKDALDLTSDGKYTVVLQNGYAVEVIPEVLTVAPSLANYAYVVDQNPTKVVAAWGSTAADYYETQVVYMDGTVATVKADDVAGANMNKIVKLTAHATNGTVKLDAIETAKFDIQENVAIDFEDAKAVGTGASKFYTSANTQILSITTEVKGTATLAKTVKLAAMPTKGDVTANFVVNTKNTTANKLDAELIVIVDGAVTVANTDLYYVVGTALSERYDATAKVNYQKVNAYELATGNKLTVEVLADSVTTGFATATVTDGIYAFTTSASNYDKTGTAAVKDITVYNGLLSIDGYYEDEDAAAVKVVDITTTGLKTVADLVAKNTTKTIEFYTVEDTDNNLAYVVVTAVTTPVVA